MLDQVQQRVLDSMRADGIALVPFHELFGDEALWGELRRHIGEFAAYTEAQPHRAPGAAEEEVVSDPAVPEERPAVHARRPVAPVRTLEPRTRHRQRLPRRTHAADRRRQLVHDPDPEADDRIASQRWHRDPWDNHIVKVFTYFSDVDEDAGPFEYLRGTPEGGRNAHLWPWEGDDVYDKHGLYPPQDEFEAKAPAEDVLTCTGPPGTMVFADTSGFHRGGWTRASRGSSPTPRTCRRSSGWTPRFEVDWSDGNGLSPEAEFAVSWSR